MIIRRATPVDAAGMGKIHVEAWRSSYAGILPDNYLASLSATRHATYYEVGILRGHLALVALESDRVIGFSTVGLRRDSTLGTGEIETLYVGLDWRERGVGRELMHEAAAALAARGASSLFLWVLSGNPSRFFYAHLGGRHAADGSTRVAGATVAKTAFVWNPIDLLLTATAPPRSD